jgi:dipeptidyl aminopeptidase/acylaminoacyl peptidase
MQIWSADGESVIYEQFGPDELQHIYRRPADRSGAAEHVYSYSEHGHSWFGLNSVSADGAILLGKSKGPPVGLAYVSLENPSEMNLFVEGREEAGARLHTARISPDGERVAYISNETGTSQVYVTTFPEDGPKLMVSSDATPGGALHPLWAPDGSGVYYTQGGQMWFVELDPDPAARPIDRRPLFDTSGRSVGADGLIVVGPPDHADVYRALGNYVISNWDIFPDGKSFLMLRDVGDKPAPPQMKIIVNFFERLERLLPAPGGQ